MRKIKNKKVAAIAVTAVALTGTGVAYAYWTTSGSGDGTASSGTAGGLLTFSQVDAPTNMVLDGTAQDIKVKVANGATYAQGTKITATPTYPAGCKAAGDWTFVSTPAFTGSIAPQGNTTVTVGTLKLNNTADNQDGCKNVQVTFAFAGVTTTE